MADLDLAATPVFQTKLVVIHPFGDFKRGDQITDPEEVQKVLASENAHHCNRV